MPQIPAAEGPRVSVIVPARDAGATLGETLASLRAQTLADLEAIVVDDASADGTRALAEAASAEDPRVRLLALPANLGTAAARNAGLREARGRWVLFLDADDWLEPDHLATLMAAAEADPGAVGAFGGYRHATADGRLGGVVRPRLEGDLFRVAARRCPFAIHACLVRREAALALGGFDPDLGPVEDWDFWQRLGRAGGRLVRVETATAVYRLRAGSAMRRPSPRYLERGLEVLRRGHAPDPRVPAPDPGHAAGRPIEELPAARARFLLYLLGNRLGLGAGAGEVLDRFEGPALAGLAPDEAAGGIAHGLLAGAGRLPEDGPALWARREAAIAAALDRLGAAAGEPGLGGALRLALEPIAVQSAEA
jgi:GT2 family glycosyltransferase